MTTLGEQARQLSDREFREHTEVVHRDCDKPACPICDGGLFLCSVCGSAEGATTSSCPGQQMTADQIDAVYAGTLDYRNGQWVEGTSPYTPAYGAHLREEA